MEIENNNKKHLDNLTSVNGQNEKSDQKYQCSTCNKPFKKLLELMEHFNRGMYFAKKTQQNAPERQKLCPSKYSLIFQNFGSYMILRVIQKLC